MNAKVIYEKAIRLLMKRINVSSHGSHPSDIESAVDLFAELLRRGFAVEGDDIADIVRAEGGSAQLEEWLQHAYEALQAHIKPHVSTWSDTAIEELLT